MTNLSVALLHDQMVDKNNRLVTTSITLIDIHDIARSCRTYGMQNFFIVHPAETVRALATKLTTHWDEGFGATYNPNRKDALGLVKILPTLDDVVQIAKERAGKRPKLVATSARPGSDRITYAKMRELQKESDEHFIIMFGTGWGMSPELLTRADYILDPIDGPSDYNHLSVRSAVAITLDRILR